MIKNCKYFTFKPKRGERKYRTEEQHQKSQFLEKKKRGEK